MSCSANVNWAHGRLGYAESVMYRKELFENSIAEAQREMAKITDAEKADAAVLAEIARFDDAVATLRTKYAERERKEKYEELTRRVKARWNDANSNFPRFPDRVVTALGELRASYVLERERGRERERERERTQLTHTRTWQARADPPRVQ